MFENLLYELDVVEDECVAVDVRSFRGTVTWRQHVRVDRLVHEERLPADCSLRNEAERVLHRERLGRIARGAAVEGLVALLRKTALDAGLQWLILNLEPQDYAFLFSTRQQERLAQALGSEAGAIEADGQRFFVLTERRVPDGQCYCLCTHHCRLFVRYEVCGPLVRIYMSDFVRTGTGRSAIRLDAAEAIHYLRALQQGTRPVGAGSPLAVKLPPAFSRPLRAGHREEHSPDGAPDAGRPALPADIRRALDRVLHSEGRDDDLLEDGRTELAGDSAADDDTAPMTSDRTELATEGAPYNDCPECGGRLFFLAPARALCLSCDWSNLATLPKQRRRRVLP
jgi:hypothetical protein